MSERTDCGQIGAQQIKTAHGDRNSDDCTNQPGSLLMWEYTPLNWLNNTAFFFHLNVAWYYSACRTYTPIKKSYQFAKTAFFSEVM